MKIAFTSTGTNWESKIDSRFGRAEYIVLYNEENEHLEIIDNSSIKNEAHGAGTLTAQKLFEAKPDVLITGNGPGENAANVLKNFNLKIYINAHNQTLSEAYENYKQNKLTEITTR